MPYLLTYARQCRRWGALPETGGLRDQPAGLLDKMAYVDAIYQATASYWQADDTTKWADSNPDSWELYARARQIEKLLDE